MEICWFETLPSTQRYVCDAVRSQTCSLPIIVATFDQTDGIGSRHNRWEGIKGNLFFSCAVERKHLPEDLPLESTSIYFAVILLTLLQNKGCDIWLKWPNDFYRQTKKVGGVMTSLIGGHVIVGIGLNIRYAPLNFDLLGVDLDPANLLETFGNKIEDAPSWKEVFSIFRVEFEKNRAYECHVDGKKVSMNEAVLQEDGSLQINQTRIYNCR